MRKVAVLIWLGMLLATIVAVFWQYEWVYSLPTPVPNNYRVVDVGASININHTLPFKTDKPVMLHFYNPDCPCSRFNIPHFKSLVNQFGHKIAFAIVPVTRKKWTTHDILKKFDLNIPVIFDTTLATACGVYSTPQAVLLNTNRQLYFRGNYNRTRYCTDTKTEYARMAINKLLQNNAAIIFDQFALKAYGCQLPKCAQ
jgi:thiol-disulfide isomerase/thioredoxin